MTLLEALRKVEEANPYNAQDSAAAWSHAVEACIEAVQALRPEAERTDWQPIETAPRDGSTILLSVPTTWEKWNRSLPLAGRWMGGLWAVFNADEAVQRVTPTHWMRLPSTPQSDTPK